MRKRVSTVGVSYFAVEAWRRRGDLRRGELRIDDVAVRLEWPIRVDATLLLQLGQRYRGTLLL